MLSRLPIPTSLCLLLLAWALLAGCDRSSSPPPTPVHPIPARGPGDTADNVGPAAPPPKAAAPGEAPDAPASAAAAAPQVEDKPAAVHAPPDKPAFTPQVEPSEAPDKPTGRVRQIARREGNSGCVEMYGTCTPPPERLCTSSAFYLDCGERAQLPSTGEWIECVCK